MYTLFTLWLAQLPHFSSQPSKEVFVQLTLKSWPSLLFVNLRAHTIWAKLQQVNFFRTPSLISQWRVYCWRQPIQRSYGSPIQPAHSSLPRKVSTWNCPLSLRMSFDNTTSKFSGGVALDEATTASFFPAEQISSSYIEISSSYLSCILELSEEIRVLAENAILFSRTSKVLMDFSNPSAATEFYKKLQAIFPVGNLRKHVRQVNLAEHAYVSCQLRHRTPDGRASTENLAPFQRRALAGNCSCAHIGSHCMSE